MRELRQVESMSAVCRGDVGKDTIEQNGRKFTCPRGKKKRGKEPEHQFKKTGWSLGDRRCATGCFGETGPLFRKKRAASKKEGSSKVTLRIPKVPTFYPTKRAKTREEIVFVYRLEGGSERF